MYAGTYSVGKIYVYDGTSWSLATDVFTILDDPEITDIDYDSHVFSLAEYNGKLYAGAEAPSASGPYGTIILVYDGYSWNIAYHTDEDQIRSLAVYNGKLYAGGYPAGIIYDFDGTSWGITFDSPEEMVIYSLAVHNDNLYAGTAIWGDIYGFDGSQWITAFDSPEREVLSLASYMGNLYAGTSEDGWIYGSCVKIIDIDIRPGSDPNSINCKNKKGIIPVAILTTDEFNATNVDHTTVYFGKNGQKQVKHILIKKLVKLNVMRKTLMAMAILI